jgi:hypothetical protein
MSHELSTPTTDTPEQIQQLPALPADQIDLLWNYTHRITDNITGRGFEGGYKSAIDHLKSKSEQTSEDVGLGEVALTAATVGAMTRNPAEFQKSAEAFTRRMVLELGISPEHATIFLRMQGDFSSRPSPENIARALSSGLKYLDGRQESFGEDTTSARIAFLASGLAATQETSLRRAIIKQLQPQS